MGRALRPGEYRCKVLYLKLSEVNEDSVDTLKFLFEWIVQYGALIGDVKRGIIAHLSTIGGQRIPFENCRLRRKNIKAPATVYVDEQKFGDDFTLTSHTEVIKNNNNLLFIYLWFAVTALSYCKKFITH